MKKVKIEDAIGMTLCHDITRMKDGFKGAAFKRGHVITKEDIEKLLDIGKRTVYIWEEHKGEIHEEDAALRMSEAAFTDGAHYEGPSEGKMQLMADRDGMFTVDKELLKAVNSIEDVTITSLPSHYPVNKGARIASMRIIPLVTGEDNIKKVEELLDGKKLFELIPYIHRKVGVVITGSEVYSGRIPDKFEPVVRAKLKAYPSEVAGIKICDDDLDMIIASAKELIDAGADVLIFTGGMSVDPDDLTPTAIRRLGAELVTHGVPSQPGNMTLVAYLKSEDPGGADKPASDAGEICTAAKNKFITVLGIPGAAIGLPVTIFDVLLPQVFTGRRFTKEELIGLCEGGLCQQCEKCHFPNCTFGRY